MVERSQALLLAELTRYDDLQRALDELRYHCYLHAQLGELQATLDEARLKELEAQRLLLEQDIRDILRKKIQQQR